MLEGSVVLNLFQRVSCLLWVVGISGCQIQNCYWRVDVVVRVAARGGTCLVVGGLLCKAPYYCR
jgi:hypothetical protein